MSVSWPIYDITDPFSKYTDHEIWRKRHCRKKYMKKLDDLVEEKIHDKYKGNNRRVNKRFNSRTS